MRMSKIDQSFGTLGDGGFESPYTTHDSVIITSSNKVMTKRRRFTREEVLAAAKKMIDNKDPRVCY